MSTPQSDPTVNFAVQKKPRHVPRRVPLSCEPCRKHKVKCDRAVPCSTCSRHNREERCLLDPAPPRGRRKNSHPKQRIQSQRECNVVANSSSPATVAAALQRSSPQGSGNLSAQLWSDTPSHETAEFVANIPVTEKRRGPGHSVENVQVSTVAQSLSSRHQQLLTAGDSSTSHSNGATNVLFPQNLPLLQFSSGGDGSFLDNLILSDDDVQWKKLLVKFLPTRNQADILLSYFVEHINWIFQTVHVPTFRKEYSTFWDGEVEDVDLPWMSLLFTILSLSALYIPVDVVEVVGLQRDSVRKYSHIWHRACLQALQAGDHEGKPTLSQLQTFSVTQLYWYATNNTETINSRMGQAVRNAQALGLDKDHTPARNVAEEMRHRLWWDLVDSDTFQSVCLDRPPLIQVHLTNVPLPLNCDDLDLGPDFACARPMNEPTAMSMNIYRAKIFQLLNRALVTDPSQLQSYDSVVEIDKRLLKIMKELPWYFQLDGMQSPKTFSAAHEFLTWQNHILRTCVSTQRVRMYRPFLDRVEVAFPLCIGTMEGALLVYRTLQSNKPIATQQKFYPQAYQIFSVAVTLATLLLVELTDLNDTRLLVDIKSMAEDLGQLEAQTCPVPVAVNGRNVLLKMLSLFEKGESCSPEDAEDLVPHISIILGGEDTTRAYLRRRTATETRHSTQVQPRLNDLVDQGDVGRQLQSSEMTTDALTNARSVDQERSWTPLIGAGDELFDSGDLQLSDSYGLFNWDATGLLSDALANGWQ